MIGRIVGRILATCLVFVAVWPIIQMAYVSLVPQSAWLQAAPEHNLGQFTVRNYQDAFEQLDLPSKFQTGLRVSLSVMLVVLVIGVPVLTELSSAGPIASATSALRFLSFRLLPPIAAVVPILYLFNRRSLWPSEVGLVFLHCGLALPLFIWLAVPLLKLVGQSRGDMVRSLTSNTIKQARLLFSTRILIAIILVAFLMGLLVWNETLFTSLFGVDTPAATIPSLITTRGTQWGLLMATALLVAAPGIVLGMVLWVITKIYVTEAK